MTINSPFTSKVSQGSKYSNQVSGFSRYCQTLWLYVGTNGVNLALFCPSTISWIDCHCDLPHSLLHALLPPLGPWHPDNTHGWLLGQALVGVGWGGSARVHHLAGGHGRGVSQLIGPWELPQLFSVPIICHLGPKLPDCTSSLLVRSFPESWPVSTLTFDLKLFKKFDGECKTHLKDKSWFSSKIHHIYKSENTNDLIFHEQGLVSH